MRIFLIIVIAFVVLLTLFILIVKYDKNTKEKRTFIGFWKWVTGRKKPSPEQVNPIPNEPKNPWLKNLGIWFKNLFSSIYNFFVSLFLGSPEERKERKQRKEKKRAEKADWRRVRKAHKERMMSIKEEEKRAKAARAEPSFFHKLINDIIEGRRERRKRKRERLQGLPPVPTFTEIVRKNFDEWLERFKRRREERRRKKEEKEAEERRRKEEQGEEETPEKVSGWSMFFNFLFIAIGELILYTFTENVWICLGALAAGFILYIAVSFIWLGIITRRAKEDINYTFLEKGEGKLIMAGENVVRILSNFSNGYFNDRGIWVDCKDHPEWMPNYGPLFKEAGIVRYGDYPVDQIYEFMEEFSEYVRGEIKEAKENSGNKKDLVQLYAMTKKQVKVNSFKRFYVNAIEIKNIEMKGETKIDMILIVTYRVINIVKALFKIKPDGIVLSQAAIATKTAVGDVMKDFESYQYFRDQVNKADQEGLFVKDVREKSNDITEDGLGLVIDKIELAYYDLSLGEPGDEELEKSMKADVIAKNLGKAYKTKRTAEQEADADYAQAMVEKLGQGNAANIMALQQIKDTQLKVYNSPVTPVVSVDDDKNKSGGNKS
jgi:hypothetical protein